MQISKDVICQKCQKVFCCSDCRIKHEKNSHAVVQTNLLELEDGIKNFSIKANCPICDSQPLVLYPEMNNEILMHIATNHFPLSCKKCLKTFEKVEDLLEFSKCFKQNRPCLVNIDEDSKTSLKPHLSKDPSTATISTQTSPFRLPNNDINDSGNHATPISMINMRWKVKSKITEGFVSDSVSSINNSSIRKSEMIASSKGKLVRSTSTPLQSEIFPKPKEQLSCHVSSIYNSRNESENSPPQIVNAITPSCRAMEMVNRYQKVRARVKMPVTPLRQVMSKSIQKAIAEHGMVRSPIPFRKNMLDSVDTSGSNVASPIDLRMSPVLRRTQSEIIERSSHLEGADLSSIRQTSARSILLSSQKTTESIRITATRMASLTNSSQTQDAQADNFNSVYQTCRSFEIITKTELSEINIDQKDIITSTTIPPITPRIGGALVQKKIINFETPNFCDSQSLNSTIDEVFHTPNSTPLKMDPSRVSDLSYLQNSQPKVLARQTNIDDDDNDIVTLQNDVSVEDVPKKKKGRGNLWSYVSAVMRLPSLSKQKKPTVTNPPVEKSSSLIKRCASFAGSLVKPSPEEEEETDMHTLKRKRTYTDVQAIYRSQAEISQTDLDSNTSTKRLRIQGRKPIERMRQNS